MAGEIAAATLATLHNLSFYLDILRRARQAILLGRFDGFRSEWLQKLAGPAAS
jgi:tRNA-guanine family transglycosylase